MPLPGTETPRGATWPSRFPDVTAAAGVFAVVPCMISTAPVTAAPLATVTATTAAAALIAAPPTRNPPPVVAPAPRPAPVPAAVLAPAAPRPTPVPVAVPAPPADAPVVAGTRWSVAALAVPAPSRPLKR